MTSTQTPPIAALLGEIHQESKATRSLLERLPEARLTWRPHPKCFTLGQQALHIARIPSAFAKLLSGDAFDSATTDTSTAQPASKAQILAAFTQGLADVDAAFASWTAADLGRTWRVMKGQTELMALPKAAGLRYFLCNHVYHHRGQLALYLRMLDVRLPPVYGPTADENPFA